MKEKIFIRIIFNIFTYLFDLLINYLLLLKLSVELYGIIAFVNSLILFFTMFINIGFDEIYIQHNSDKDFNNYFSNFLFIKVILIIGNYIPFISIIIFLNLEELVLNFLILKLIYSILDNFAYPWLVNLESRKKIIKKELVLIVSDIVKSSLIVYIVLSFESLSNLLIYLGNIYIIYAFLKLFIILIFKNEFILLHIDKSLLKKFIKDTKPLIMLNIFASIVNNIGTILLGFSFGNEALAYYYIVYNYIITFLLIISQQINQIFTIYFPEKFKNKNIKNIQILTHTAEKYSSIFFLSIIIFVFLYGKLIFEILLPKYSESLIYLYILIFIPFFAGTTRPYISHLLSNKKQKLFSNYLIIKLIFIIILKLTIIPRELFSIKMLGLGGYGLALILVCSWIIDVFFYRYFSRKMGIFINKRILIHVICAIFTLIVSYSISTYLLRITNLNGYMYIILTPMLFIGLFILELILLKEINKNDFRFILNLIKFSKYRETFLEEMGNENKKI